jgi:hypothetical protein
MTAGQAIFLEESLPFFCPFFWMPGDWAGTSHKKKAEREVLSAQNPLNAVSSSGDIDAEIASQMGIGVFTFKIEMTGVHMSACPFFF